MKERKSRFGWLRLYWPQVVAGIAILVIAALALVLVTRQNTNQAILGVVIGLAFSGLTQLAVHLLTLQKDQVKWEREMQLKEAQQRERTVNDLRSAYEAAIRDTSIYVQAFSVETMSKTQASLARLSLFLPHDELAEGFPDKFKTGISGFRNDLEALVDSEFRGPDIHRRNIARRVRELSFNDPRLSGQLAVES